MHKVCLGDFERLRLGGTVGELKIAPQPLFFRVAVGLLQPVDGGGVPEELNEAGGLGRGEDSVGLQPDWEALGHED